MTGRLGSRAYVTAVSDAKGADAEIVFAVQAPGLVQLNIRLPVGTVRLLVSVGGYGADNAQLNIVSVQ